MSGGVVNTAKVGDVEIAYETFGSPDDTPVLLIMGLATQMLAWREEFCQLLVAEGRYVIRFDNRDVGLSTHHDQAPVPNLRAVAAGDTSSATYTLEDMADDTVGLLDVLEIERAHVVGVSMGGMIAQTVAIRHPERVRSLTSIMSTPGTRVGRATPEASAALMLPPAGNRDEAVQRTLAVYRAIGSPGYPANEEELADLARRSYDRAHDPLSAVRHLAAIYASGDRTAALASVRIPALVLHGEDDPLVGLDGGQATAAAIAGARLVTYPGMGHDLPPALWPELIAEIGALTEQSDN
ncbi:alpha/beta fold hydrolase [Aldersonia kunmingensis]|uniref:alpha/beta fold hydrolase n=1 Tax=Aldersonia kunmingensis TaxID=408066 RepID=UPI00082A9410|nr:alpha/beta hydrolase [Aldersonia kunmingensis]